jgi:hypothetical protein
VAKKWPGDYLTNKNSLPPWVLFYNVAGYEYYPEDRVSYQCKNIRDVTQRIGVDSVKAIGGVSAKEILKRVHQPSEEPYWKLRNKGGCEDILFLTIYDKLESLVGVMNELADKYSYPASDMGVYIQPVVQGTSCHCEFNLFYDPENPDEVDRVKELSNAATKTLTAHGAFFSRPYGDNTGTIMNRDAAGVAVISRVKKIFDPNNIMNPGKLCF